MSKYNTKRESLVKKTTSHEGGLAYTQTPERELVGLLSTGIQNSYYEAEGEREKRLADLISTIAKKDKTFAAKALVYARSVFGQRTVTHLGAVNLLPHLSGDELGKRFFSKRDRKENIGGIVYRIDDMTEILACYLAKNGKDAPIPNSIKKGFKSAIESADAYQLAKYQMKGKSISLVDIVNLVHPRETEKNGYVNIPEHVYLKSVKGTKFENDPIEGAHGSEEGTYVNIPTLRALVLGVLKQFNTSEDKNTEAGKEVAAAVKAGELTKDEAAKVLTEKKAENYGELIRSKKIGYLALIRNLRNIIKTGDESLLRDALELVVNKDMIRKSLIWPHQIDIAMEVMLLEMRGPVLQKVTHALGEAYELSIPNLSELLPPGRTAVVFDTSGSMQGSWGNGVQLYNGKKFNKINSSPAEKAALIAATFAKGTGGRVYHFGRTAAEITGWNPNDSINSLKKEFLSHNGDCGHATYIEAAFELFMNQRETYDRVVIISDEQGHGNLEKVSKEYSRKFGTPYIYFINVCGYSNVSLKEGNKILRLQGYSADIYEKIKDLEIDVAKVLEEIRAIEI